MLGKFNIPILPGNIIRARNGECATHSHVKSGNKYWVFDLEINATTGALMIRYMGADGASYSRTVQEFSEKFQALRSPYAEEWWTEYYVQKYAIVTKEGKELHNTLQDAYNAALMNNQITWLDHRFLDDRTHCTLLNGVTIEPRWTYTGPGEAA